MVYIVKHVTSDTNAKHTTKCTNYRAVTQLSIFQPIGDNKKIFLEYYKGFILAQEGKPRSQFQFRSISVTLK